MSPSITMGPISQNVDKKDNFLFSTLFLFFPYAYIFPGKVFPQSTNQWLQETFDQISISWWHRFGERCSNQLLIACLVTPIEGSKEVKNEGARLKLCTFCFQYGQATLLLNLIYIATKV